MIVEMTTVYENGALRGILQKSIIGSDLKSTEMKIFCKNWDFDEYGNWRKRQRNNNPNTLITREIEYYQ